jgi:hypothetical protein
MSPSSSHGGSRIERRLHDALIAGAAAKISRDRVPDSGFAGFGIFAQESEKGHQHTGGTETALQAMPLAEGMLKRMKFSSRAKTLDGFDIGAVGLDGKHEAGANGGAAHDDRARTADAVLAAKMGSRQPKSLAQKVGEVNARLGFARIWLSVYG